MIGDHLGSLDTDGRIILKWIFKTRWGVGGGGGDSVDWIHLAQDMVQWPDLVNMLMNIP
jgi:hypothetical protein